MIGGPKGICLLASLLAACGSDTSAPRQIDLELLTYNVAGLPSELSGGTPSVNSPLISPLLNHFDLALLQEDFAYHEALAAETTQSFGYAPGPKAFGKAFGDGLAAFSTVELSAPERVMWRSCSGMVDRRNDCLASKGFTFVELSASAGQRLGVYNLHMDAGKDALDAEARADQVEQLLEHMASRPQMALIVAGDSNTKSESRAEDKPIYTRLVEGGELVDACRALDCAEPDRIDRVFYRSGSEVEIVASSWSLDGRFVDGEGLPLSDHEPLVVTLQIVVAE